MNISVTQSPYQAEIEGWRRRMDESLRVDRGWLTLAGLFWLNEGANRFGTSLDNEIVLPEGSAPNYAGSIVYQAGTATLHADASAGVAVNGQPGATAPLRSDADTTPDLVTLGDLAMLVIQRGERHAVRLWDQGNPA